jgi:hypothetical protein
MLCTGTPARDTVGSDDGIRKLTVAWASMYVAIDLTLFRVKSLGDNFQGITSLELSPYLFISYAENWYSLCSSPSNYGSCKLQNK